MNALLVKAIALTGLLAGTLDILAACTQAYLAGRVPPLRVLQFVASGLFGRGAFASTSMAGWGLLMHYGIALGWTALYFLLYPTLSKFSSNFWVNGFGYGLFVWLMMTFVLLPLSQVAQRPFAWGPAIIGAIIIMLCIGLPIAWGARQHYGA